MQNRESENYSDYYAHTLKGRPPSEWQKLEDHLMGTAERAAGFASDFNCSEWGYLAGLWHDLGKYAPAFQRYIRTTSDLDAHIEGSNPERVDHSTAGAIWSVRHFQEIGTILAYSLAGHHAGLADYENDTSGRSSLSQRLKQTGLLDDALSADIPVDILERSIPVERPAPGADPAFWTRLLFSCVVDADFLDTEAFLNPGKAAARPRYHGPPPERRSIRRSGGISRQRYGNCNGSRGSYVNPAEYGAYRDVLPGASTIP